MSDDMRTDDAEDSASKDQPSEAKAAATADAPRRTVLRTLVAAGSAVYAGAIVVPALGYLSSTGESGGSGGKERWMRIAPLTTIKDKTPVRVKVTGDERDAFTITRNKTLGSVWLQRDGDKVSAMSAECPHLGCAIDVGGDGKSFGCPCHTSRFSLAGSAESGPSPRGMDKLNARVKDGWVEVDFRRFRQGVSEQVEVV